MDSTVKEAQAGPSPAAVSLALSILGFALTLAIGSLRGLSPERLVVRSLVVAVAFGAVTAAAYRAFAAICRRFAATDDGPGSDTHQEETPTPADDKMP